MSEGFLWGIVGILLVIMIGLVIADGVNASHHRKTFMAECLQDHKQYECDALWGQTRSSPSHTTPVPIIIPMSR